MEIFSKLDGRHVRNEDYMDSLDAPDWLPSGWQGEVAREDVKGGY